MAIPLVLFYYLYLVFVAIFLLYTLFNIYHLARFGGKTLTTLAITAFYIAFSIVIITTAWGYIGPIDWTNSIQLTPNLNRSL